MREFWNFLCKVIRRPYTWTGVYVGLIPHNSSQAARVYDVYTAATQVYLQLQNGGVNYCRQNDVSAVSYVCSPLTRALLLLECGVRMCDFSASISTVGT